MRRNVLPPMMRENRDLPNQNGFEFLAVKADGSTWRCVVEKRENGTHHVLGVPYCEIIGWYQLGEI